MSLDGRIEQLKFPLLAKINRLLLNIEDIPRRNVPISYFVLTRDIENSFAL